MLEDKFALFYIADFIPFSVFSLLDILIVSFIFYQLLRLIRGTPAAQMVFGLLLLVTVAIAGPELEMRALAWLLEQDGVAVIPKSRSRERIEENWGSLQVRLTDEVRMAMDAWPKDLRTVDPPAFGIEWDKD